MSSKRGDCVVCGKTNITLPALGKCSVCYDKYRKEIGMKGPLVVSNPAPKKRDDLKTKAVTRPAVEDDFCDICGVFPCDCFGVDHPADVAVTSPAIEADYLVPDTEIVLCDVCGNEPCLCSKGSFDAADVIDESGWVQPVIVFGVDHTAALGAASDAIGNRDFHAYLKELAHTKVEEWITDLNKAKDPREYAMLYANMCDALEGMRY